MLYTIGYGNNSINRLILRLKEEGIEMLIDVRSIPWSKWQSDFNKENLEIKLKEAGIEYRWYKILGGKEKSIDYAKRQQSIKKLSNRINEKKLVIMCSESDENKCHRKDLAKEIAGEVEVIHLHVKPLLTKEKLFPDQLMFCL